MPLVILTGFPCSGLTYRATQLSALFSQIQDAVVASSESRSLYKIQVVPSHDSTAGGGHPRTVYDTARAEKEARAVTYARIKRALARDTIVIADGMNYIKGWRYQLWCEAKAAGTTCCVVHVGTPHDVCVANNTKRQKDTTETAGTTSDSSNHANQRNEEDGSSMTDADEDPYPVNLLNNLIYRYEEPSTHSRWDQPLFTVPYMDQRPPAKDIWFSLTGISAPRSESENAAVPRTLTAAALLGRSNENNDQKTSQPAPTANSTLTPRRTIQPRVIPHQATVQPAATDPGALQNYEKRTADVISALRAFTTKFPSIAAALASPDHAARVDGEEGLLIGMASVCETAVFIPTAVLETAPSDDIAGAGGILALPRLQRLRRQWIGMNRAYIAGRAAGSGKSGVSIDQVADAFVRFLNAEMGNSR